MNGHWHFGDSALVGSRKRGRLKPPVFVCVCVCVVCVCVCVCVNVWCVRACVVCVCVCVCVCVVCVCVVCVCRECVVSWMQLQFGKNIGFSNIYRFQEAKTFYKNFSEVVLYNCSKKCVDHTFP